MIEAGTFAQISWSTGPWVFLDIGFARDAKSCGLLVGDGEPECLRYGQATERLGELVRLATSPVHLVIEAPLSVCFGRDGNPKGRSIEKEGVKTRYWYNGLGCAVMVASLYLVRSLDALRPTVPVRLFEGFVSYKDRSVPSDHGGDVRLLRDVVRSPVGGAGRIIPPELLKQADDDRLVSAFEVAGLDCGVPPVIRPDTTPLPQRGG